MRQYQDRYFRMGGIVQFHNATQANRQYQIPIPAGFIRLLRQMRWVATFISILVFILTHYAMAWSNGFFSPTGLMGTARVAHTATLLPNGKVLIAGGWVASAELYDPMAGTFNVTGTMGEARANHTATLLPNGKVLIAGGWNGLSGHLASAELYDPTTGTFSATGTMGVVRATHTATLLPNGKVLIAGEAYSSSSSAELYDPATETFTPTGAMSTGRGGFYTATLLPNGKVLITGGLGNNIYFATAELYDPETGTFTPTGSMGTERAFHAATLLPNGKVLITGGWNNGVYGSLSSAELYDPATGTFTATGSMGTPRNTHTATLLTNSKVLITGGTTNTGEIASAELYELAIGSFISAGSMGAARAWQTATLLLNSKVLITGGVANAANHNSAELYTSMGDATFQKVFNANVTSSYSVLEVIQTADGIITAGGANGNMFLLKTDFEGNIIFYKTYDDFSATSVDQTSDGGFIIAGERFSYNDYALVKTDSYGNVQWSKSYDTGYHEQGLYSVRQTPDGGYIAAGIFTVKFDSNGEVQWSNIHIGGGGNTLSIRLTNDGGYIATGTGQYGNPADSYNIVLTKLNPNGTAQWNKVFGGNGYDWSSGAQETSDGGYIIGGWTESFGAGGSDCSLIKTNSLGVVQWAKTYGGSGNDYCYGIRQTSEGGYVLTGSFNGQMYLIKTNANGGLEWSRSYGTGTGYSVYPSLDGGYIIAGKSGTGSLTLIKTDSNGGTGSCIYSTPSTTVTSPVFITGNNNTSAVAAWVSTILPTLAITNSLSTISSCVNVTNTYYRDADTDGYGNALISIQAGVAPAGYVSNSSDCNDNNASINPAAPEVCNGVDDNCNTQIDESVQNTYYQDSDADSYGNALMITLACISPSGYVSDNTDCNDTNASINPAAAEICNGVDDNCNTQIDDACLLTTDLSISLADLPDPVTPAGQDVTYTITVTNNGPAYATNVTVTDVLDASLTLVSATPSQGAPCTGTGTITCNLGSMISGSSATVTIVATTSLTPGMIGNSASVTATEPDPNNTNNTAVQTTNVGDISREVGISTRGYVETGTNIMVGGFSFGGTVSKKVLIRGRGPSMSGAPYNFTGTLTNPTLEIYSGTTLFATIDDWQAGATMCNAPAENCGTPAELLAALTDPCQPNAGQTTAPPGCMQEAALYITLPPGAYTVKLKGVLPSDIGKGIMEVYDADTSSLTMLGGISTRGKVLTGTDVMVGGFIVGAGSTNKTLLLRGRGPSLSGAPYNFTGTLTNPTLEIYSGATLFATVDDWQSGATMCNAPALSCGTPAQLETALVDPCQPNVGQTTAPPGCMQESAMFITLPPGAYTAKLKGVNNDTGIGIFEVYEVTP